MSTNSPAPELENGTSMTRGPIAAWMSASKSTTTRPGSNTTRPRPLIPLWLVSSRPAGVSSDAMYTVDSAIVKTPSGIGPPCRSGGSPTMSWPRKGDTSTSPMSGKHAPPS